MKQSKNTEGQTGLGFASGWAKLNGLLVSTDGSIEIEDVSGVEKVLFEGIAETAQKPHTGQIAFAIIIVRDWDRRESLVMSHAQPP